APAVPVSGCQRDTQFGLPAGAPTNIDIYTMAANGTDLYFGGAFTAAGTIAANHVAKFNTTTHTWSALSQGNGNGVDSSVYALAFIGNDLYVGGFLSKANSGGSGASPEVPANNV